MILPIKLEKTEAHLNEMKAVLSDFKAYICLSFFLNLDGLIKVYACEMVEVDEFRSRVK